MLEANLRLKVTKVALDADGALAFIREAPVTGLDEEGFLQAFWGLLAAAEAYWEDLEQIGQ
jgi:hypothetical protein